MATTNFDLERDVSKATDILNEVALHLRKESILVDNLIGRLKNGEITTHSGLSILELKNQTLLSYLINFEFTTLMKLSGEKFEDNPTIDRLVEQRVLLEKIRPLEFKLKNQISKYAKVQTTDGSGNSTIPKNSLDDISDGDSNDEEGGDEGDTKASKKAAVYKLPKISQVAYPEAIEKESSQTKKDARERKRYLESDMMADALDEYNENPEEIDAKSGLKRKALKKIKEIQSYEEDNFTRLSLTKKEKNTLEQVMTSGNLASELLNFRTLDAIGKPSDASKKKKKKPIVKGSKKKRKW